MVVDINMDLTKLKIYIIIVTFNGEKWIRKCLNSLINSEIPVHTIVIDNNSSDHTVKIIEQEFLNIELIKSNINLGFGKGNNIGFTMALKENADFVFLLNQDVWIEPDTISELLKQAQLHNNFGILSPLHLKPNKKSIEYYFSTIISPESCPDLISDLYFNSTEGIYPINFVHAAAWLISKNCLLKVGGFDPIFSHYGEDEDYIIRTHYFHFEVGIVPESIVYHDIDFDLEKIKNDVNRNVINSILQIKNINSSLRSNLLLFFKTNLDQISSSLLYRRFKEMFFRINVFFKTLKFIRQIIKSRKESIQESAFLKN